MSSDPFFPKGNPKETIDPLNTDEVNQAAYSFKKSVELAKNMIGHKAITQKGMARVLSAVIEFPLGDREPKFKNKAEEQLFILTLNCFKDKTVMMNAVLKNQSEKLEMLKEAENGLQQQSNTNQETVGETNELSNTTSSGEDIGTGRSETTV